MHCKVNSLSSRQAKLLLLGSIVAFGACQQSSNTPSGIPAGAQRGSQQRVFRLGILGPFTGPAARTGQEFRNAATMAFEKIGYRLGNYKVELVWIDEQSDPVKASRAYEEAVIRKGIEAGLLNWHSSVAVACMEVAAKYLGVAPRRLSMRNSALTRKSMAIGWPRFGLSQQS
ncbi:MAG: hypothetical protein DMG06_30535 [Acidobacteria bacterium]|nr:MAG: hypothetical protein DMG06_30535 [Acidobacteriota bacterium]